MSTRAHILLFKHVITGELVLGTADMLLSRRIGEQLQGRFDRLKILGGDYPTHFRPLRVM